MIGDLALLVVSCDAYTKLGTIFFDLQERFMGWFKGNRYFVNETLNVDFNGVKVVHVGNDVNWSGKVKKALDTIPEEYILFMLEDYFIGQPVKEADIDNALKIMHDHNFKYYKITNIPHLSGGSDIAEYLSYIPSNLRYGINLQAAIFRKDFLYEVISGEDRDAWKTETDLLKNVTDKFEYNIDGCVADVRNIIDIHNGVIKGMWVPATIKYFKKIGYTFDLGDRKILSFKKIIRWKVMALFKRRLSNSATKKAKRILKHFGFKFVSDN